MWVHFLERYLHEVADDDNEDENGNDDDHDDVDDENGVWTTSVCTVVSAMRKSKY